MKTTELFKNKIQEYLTQRASQDEQFRSRYENPRKSVDDCINFILHEVQKSNCNGFSDEEVYGMAVHYYDEDDLSKIKSIHCHVVINQHFELTDEEKAKARAEAIEKYQSDCLAAIKQKSRKSPVEQLEQRQLNLF